jgi:hypothetical protein
MLKSDNRHQFVYVFFFFLSKHSFWVFRVERSTMGAVVSLKYIREKKVHTLIYKPPGRQDLDFEACVAIYVNRRCYIEFLDMLMKLPDHSNVLEDFLFVVLISSDMLAAIRAHASLYVAFVTELRFLAGCSDKLKDWSPFSMARVIDIFEGWMIKGAANGQVILDLLSSGDSPFPTIEAEQPAFAAYRKHEANAKAKSPNGQELYTWLPQLRAALANPTDASNQMTTLRTLELLETFCARALLDVRDPSKRTFRYLSSQDGPLAWDTEATKVAHAETKGCHATNDILAESVFGAFDQCLKEGGPTMGVAAASGVVTVRRNGDFIRRGENTLKRKRPPSLATAPALSAAASPKGGAFHDLTLNQKISLTEYARSGYDESLKLDALVRAEHDVYWEKKRKLTREAGLKKLESRYLETLEYWEMRETRRFTIFKVKQDLEKIKAKCRRVDYLKAAIQIRVIGFGWGDLHVAWSAGGVDKTVEELTAELEAILKEEKKREVLTEAPVPSLERKTLKQLGAPIAQLEELRSVVEVNEVTFKRVAQAERERREANRETDGNQRRQPPAPPAVNDDLVGVRIEYLDKVVLEDNANVLHWFAGVVRQVSDGTAAKGGRSKKNWEAGFARVEFDVQPSLGEDEPTEKWVALRLNKFNGDAKNCWRLDLD